MPDLKHIISLGAGVQSSVMSLMAAAGEITPMPIAAVFADTQAEPKAVYVWLDWLEKQLPFPVHRVTRSSLTWEACNIRKSKAGNFWCAPALPAFIRNEQGKVGKAQRQCTQKHKIDVIYRAYNSIRDKQPVLQWIGISLDEAGRRKPARKPWVENRWPLIELQMTRTDCLMWMKKRGLPEPPRSACVYCPFHNDKEWSRLKSEDPESFQKAVRFEKSYQEALGKTTYCKGVPFLHRNLVPLDQVEFLREPEPESFAGECEGMCGV